MLTAIIGWVALGLLTGYVATSQMNRHGESLAVDLGLGTAGAVAGGWLFRAYATAGASGLSLAGALVAVAGAAVLLVIARFVRRPALRG